MDYRDERDALRARVESLEAALATAQAEVERMRATEAALEAAKREIQQLGTEVQRLRPNPNRTPQQRGGSKWLIYLGVALALPVFAIVLLLRSSKAPSPPPAPPELSPAVTTIVAQPPVVEPPPPPPEPRPTPPPAPVVERRTARAEWVATVARSQGAGPPPGTPCKVFADLAGDGSRASLGEVEVSCGTKFLYRSTDRFNGMSNTGSDVTETAGKVAGTFQHTLVYQDQGTRSGRSQISIDTSQRSGIVWSENVPAFRVELRMEPLSVARTGEALVDEENRLERLTETIVRSGAVTKVEGEPGTAVGAACTVDVSPSRSGESNCRVRVRCGGKLLYGDGQSGYNHCAVKGGRVGRLVDDRPSSKDSDPALDMDLSESTVVLSDDGDTSWKVTIGLTRAAR